MKDETIETYNHIASQYSSAHFEPFWVKEFDYFNKIIPGKKVVDIGCGAGRDAAVFVRNGFDYIGIDASQGMLDVATKRVPEGTFAHMSYYDLDLPKESFDGFWAAASLLHAAKKDIASVLQNLKTLLKPGGVGFIAVKKVQGEEAEHVKRDEKYGGRGRYFSYYEEDELTEILEEAGFTLDNFWVKYEDDEEATQWLCFFVINT